MIIPGLRRWNDRKSDAGVAGIVCEEGEGVFGDVLRGLEEQAIVVNAIAIARLFAYF